MENKKTIIKRVTCFTIILICLFILFSFIFEPKNNSPAYRMRNYQAMGFLGEEENTIDVLFLGDSEAYYTISPLDLYEKYGFTSYMCGTESQRTYIAYDLLCKFLEKQTPKYVIMEANISYYIHSDIDVVKYYAKEMVTFLNYHNRWKQLYWNDLLLGNINYTYSDPYKGFRIFTAVRPTDNEPYMIYNENEKFMDAGNERYINKIKEKCEEIGAQLIFMATPNKHHWTYEKHNGTLAYCQANGIDFIDLNIDNVCNIDYQYDTCDAGEHLNYSGSTKVTTYLGQILVDNYDLTDRRNDANFQASWQDLLPQFRIDIANSTK